MSEWTRERDLRFDDCEMHSALRVSRCVCRSLLSLANKYYSGCRFNAFSFDLFKHLENAFLFSTFHHPTLIEMPKNENFHNKCTYIQKQCSMGTAIELSKLTNRRWLRFIRFSSIFHIFYLAYLSRSLSLYANTRYTVF